MFRGPHAASDSCLILHRLKPRLPNLFPSCRALSTTTHFLPRCNSLITQHGRKGNIREAESLFSRMPRKNTVSWTALLTAYSDNGLIDCSRRVFDQMPHRTTASYNAMITAYIRNDRTINRAFELFSRIPHPNSVTFAAMITGFVHAGMLDEARRLFDDTPLELRDPVCSNVLISGYLKAGLLEEAAEVFERMVNRDVVSWSSMVDGYSKKGGIEEARGLFDRMPERNVVSWTAMIDGYMRTGDFEGGFRLFKDMRRERDIRVNSTTLAVVIEACTDFGRCREFLQMHGVVFLLGFKPDTFLGNSMIILHSSFGQTKAARMLFDEMENKDLVTWNSLISGYVQNYEVGEAFKLFNKLPGKDAVSWTTMISGFFGNGDVEKSTKLFQAMPSKDDVAWTAMISGFSSNELHEDAFRWFRIMLQQAVRPNPLTLSSVISASAGLATLNQGMQIHALVLKMCFEQVLSVQNSLISMYSKCGSMQDACQIFMTIAHPNIISYNSVISGLASNGYCLEALKLFEMMENDNLEANEISFLAVLSACTHGGLVDEGWNYLRSMKSVYGIEPSPDHYACVVDLLGRAGRLVEAISLVHSESLGLHPGVWGALMSASMMHARLDMAELAAQRLVKLQPDNATPYVVLSSLYSLSGRSYDSGNMMVVRKCKGVRKSPGCSWIILKDSVHLFLSGDKSHPESEEIKATLRTISKEVQLSEHRA